MKSEKINNVIDIRVAIAKKVEEGNEITTGKILNTKTEIIDFSSKKKIEFETVQEEMDAIEALVSEVVKIEEKISEGKTENKPNEVSIVPSKLSKEEQEEMAENNLKLVHLAAKHYANKNVSHDEFFSVALIGYTKALQNYDRDKSNFSTFAMRCMTNEMNQYLRKEKKNQDNLSTSTPLYVNGEGGEFTIAETLSGEDYEQPSCDDVLLLNQDIMILLESINKLTEKEQFIIKNRFGVGGVRILTQSEVARHLETSQANISKMEAMILNKLKKYMRGKMNSIEGEDLDDRNIDGK